MAFSPKINQSKTSGVLTGKQSSAPATSKTSVINPDYAETSLANFSPEQQEQLSALLDAVQKSYGQLLTTNQVEALLQNRSDFFSDIPREGLTARINREMPKFINTVKMLAKEEEQASFQERAQATIEEAMAQGKELSERQLRLLEEQTGMAREELQQIQAARKEALEQAKVQAASSRTVADRLYQQAGLKPSYDESGVLVGLESMSEDELTGSMTALQRQQYQVAKQTTQRQLDALAGKYDMDPALQKSLDDQEKELKAVLEQKLGPNYMQSTAGIQAMSSFSESKQRIQEAARQSYLQTGQGLISSSLQNVFAGRQAEQAAAAGAATTGAQLGQVGITAPLAASPVQRQVTPGEYGGVLSTTLTPVTAGAPTVFGGYQNVLAPLYSQRDYDRQIAAMIQQRSIQDQGSPWSGVLTGLLGTATSAGLAYVTGGGSLPFTGATGAGLPGGAPSGGSINLPPPR